MQQEATMTLCDRVALGSYAVREESRKFWNNFPNDELVYIAKVADANVEFSHVLAEKYVRGDLWLHIRWSMVEPGQVGHRHYEAIVDGVRFDHSLHPSLLKLNNPIPAIDWDGSMLVDVPELVEFPEVVRVHGITSVVRLKGVKGFVDASVEERPFGFVGFVAATDWENDLAPHLLVGDGIGKEVDKAPCKLVEGGAKTVKKIANGQGDVFGDCHSGNYVNVLRSLAIVFLDNGVRLAFNPISDLRLSRLEVKLCPSGLHVNVLN